MRPQARPSSRLIRRFSHGYDEAREAAEYLRARWPVAPRVAITLGSGLGELVRGVKGGRIFPFDSIPHFPRLSVAGHEGVLHVGLWNRVPVAVLQGRAHLYEGFVPTEVVFPVRALGLAGVQVFVMTCAAGGIAAQARPGRRMVISDHLNLQSANPLAGTHDQRWGTRFVDLTQAYDTQLRRDALKAAATLRLKCAEGVYASLPGPNYETPAEIRALQRMGADAVGMSTVPEVLAARQLGARVLAIAVITNRAAGLSERPLRHEDVMEAGKSAGRDLARLLASVLPAVKKESPSRSS